MADTTRAQESACEMLALRHDRVRITPLGDGTVRVDCLDRVGAHGWHHVAGLRHVEAYIVRPDGGREPVTW